MTTAIRRGTTLKSSPVRSRPSAIPSDPDEVGIWTGTETKYERFAQLCERRKLSYSVFEKRKNHGGTSWRCCMR
jgi:hypothetical protein